MESESDEVKERLIESFTPRIRRLIAVNRVLDHMHSLEPGLKERIRQRAATDGDSAAAGDLISAVLKKPRAAGWFRAFVDALLHSGCESAADYIQTPPEPEVEAENDYCVMLVELLSPSLVDMKTDVVCHECFSQGLINQDDDEIVSAPIVFYCGEKCNIKHNIVTAPVCSLEKEKSCGLFFLSHICLEVVSAVIDHKMADRCKATHLLQGALNVIS